MNANEWDRQGGVMLFDSVQVHQNPRFAYFALTRAVDGGTTPFSLK
jgi:hypothetical protein